MIPSFVFANKGKQQKYCLNKDIKGVFLDNELINVFNAKSIEEQQKKEKKLNKDSKNSLNSYSSSNFPTKSC